MAFEQAIILGSFGVSIFLSFWALFLEERMRFLKPLFFGMSLFFVGAIIRLSSILSQINNSAGYDTTNLTSILDTLFYVYVPISMFVFIVFSLYSVIDAIYFIKESAEKRRNKELGEEDAKNELY